MIIAYDVIFDYIGTILFQLAERIAITEKSMKSVLGHCTDVLGFSYNAIPTRHEVPEKPYLQEEILYGLRTNPQNYQTLRIWRVKKEYIADLSVKTLKSYAVLIDIKWTTAQPNAVYKDISEGFRGFSVYVAESEAECKMVQQKWKRSERATHIMGLRRQAKATIRKQTIALGTVRDYSRLTVGKTIIEISVCETQPSISTECLPG